MNCYHKSIPPCTELIRAMIDAEGMSLKKAIAELIANAIDQNAKNIALAYDAQKGRATIVDDGNGPPEGLEKLAEIGRHISTKSDPIGRFGVGHKDAICWLANIANVHSMTRRGIRQKMHVDWARMMAIKDWDFEFAYDSLRASHGLSIILHELRPHRFRSWVELPRYISELFSAAIDAGIVITVDGTLVKSLPVPALEHRIEFKGEHDGLKFKGFAGLLKNKGEAPSGWDIRYGAQSVKTGYIKEGFGTASPQGFYGRFEMINGTRRWHLTRNKTDSEDLYDVLNCEEMQKVIQPLLRLLKERTETLKIRMNMQLVSSSLTNMLRNAKVRIEEEQEEKITVPKPDGTILEEGGRGPGPGPEPGPGPKPRPPRLVPSEEITRPKRRYDPLSPVKDRIKQVQSVEIAPHYDTKTKGFFFLNVIERGTHITIHIDIRSVFGSRMWEDKVALFHYAVMCLASYFGLGVDVLNQLRLPIGDAGDPNELKISKSLAYLVDNVELDQFFTANGNGNGKHE